MNTTFKGRFYGIDTLQFSKRMQKAGLQEEVADELARALKEIYDQHPTSFATKADIELIIKDLELTRRIVTK